MTPKQLAYAKIQDLVTRFTAQYASYKSADYNETQTRRDFIDPFFKALGWDIDNEQGYSEAYREVIHEDRIKIAGHNKAPDYSFKLVGGKRLFFVEAKKPSVIIKDDMAPAYQVRRYGWSAKMQISIITDFEEFAIYDCTTKPKPTDKASNGRIKYFTYLQYATEFDFLWDTFAKENILRGSFDKYLQSASTNKKGTTTVDYEFLQSLDEWRTYLATSIATKNKQLTEEELNFIVQHTLDRLIFLRIAEDRSVEPYANLQATTKSGDYYQNLLQLFHTADQKYNSGLFDFAKDTISNTISIDNKTLKTIINDLYYPISPYEFSVLSVEILGSAYEQFLGKTITLSKSGKAIIEQKPEVRKAGGVYYTPQFIVEYIVANTIGKLVHGKKPADITKLKIIDPACGSGSFLIGAYNYLLNWHKDYYSNNGKPSKGNKDNPLTPDGYLTTAEKKRILLNNIFGVDLDANAVEVTKLSLLLKCMEGETEASINTQQKLFHDRILPTLDGNIKSGNSLIEVDFYNSQMDFGEDRKVKPFNWKKNFEEVFKQGGFDVVIGNPPYVKIQTLQANNPHQLFDYFKQKYESAKAGNYDLYVLFIEFGYNLLNHKGLLAYIQPHKFFQSEFGDGIRNFISKNKAIEQIVNFGANQIFDGATTYTCLLFLNKKFNKEFQLINVANHLDWSIDKSQMETFEIPQPIQDSKWNFTSADNQSLLDKLNAMPQRLSDITRKIFVGLQTSADKVYVLQIIEWKKETVICFSKSLDKQIEIEIDLVKPFLMGKDVKRYQQPKPKNVVIFPYQIVEGKAHLMDKTFIKTNYPKGWEYLKENKTELENRESGKMKHEKFYAYIYPKNLSEFEIPKLMTPEIAINCHFTFDNLNLYHTTKVYSVAFNQGLKEEVNYFLGLLNSKIMWYFLSSTGSVFSGGYYTFKTQFLNPFPIKRIDFKNKIEVSIHNDIVKLVSQLLVFNKEIILETLPNKKQQLQDRIEFAEDKINELVYGLYELTEVEIKIIEG